MLVGIYLEIRGTHFDQKGTVRKCDGRKYLVVHIELQETVLT